jgi:hypothetical protein
LGFLLRYYFLSCYDFLLCLLFCLFLRGHNDSSLCFSRRAQPLPEAGALVCTSSNPGSA